MASPGGAGNAPHAALQSGSQSGQMMLSYRDQRSDSGLSHTCTCPMPTKHGPKSFSAASSVQLPSPMLPKRLCDATSDLSPFLETHLPHKALGSPGPQLEQVQRKHHLLAPCSLCHALQGHVLEGRDPPSCTLTSSTYMSRLLWHLTRAPPACS